MPATRSCQSAKNSACFASSIMNVPRNMTQSKRSSALEAAIIGRSSSVTACSPAKKRTVMPRICRRCASDRRCQSSASWPKSSSRGFQTFATAFSYLR